jgi:hypothetical protein
VKSGARGAGSVHSTQYTVHSWGGRGDDGNRPVYAESGGMKEESIHNSKCTMHNAQLERGKGLGAGRAPRSGVVPLLWRGAAKRRGGRPPAKQEAYRKFCSDKMGTADCVRKHWQQPPGIVGARIGVSYGSNQPAVTRMSILSWVGGNSG